MGGRGRGLIPLGNSPRRGIGIVRVSRERDDMVSPELQRAAIGDYAERHGIVICDWVEGIDESGSRSSSSWWARLDEVVGRCESGEAQVIVAHKFNRAARNRLRWAVTLERLEAAGGQLLSATEDVDTTTATGRFTRGMLGEVAAWEAEAIGDRWREAHARRVSLGLPSSGRPRFGYVWDGSYTPDPVAGPLLAECYRRYVAGISLRELARWLNSQGALTVRGTRWSGQTLGAYLATGFAAGRLRVGTLPRRSAATFLPAAHPALIDDALWQAYQDRRETVAATAPRLRRATYMLSGLVRCGLCEGAMVVNYTSGRPDPRYVCGLHRRDHQRCAGQSIRLDRVEEFVVGWLRAELTDEDARNAGTVARAAARAAAKADVAVLDSQLAKIAAKRDRLTATWLEAGIPQTTMRKAMEDLAAQEAEVRGALRAARRDAGAPTRPWRGGVAAFLAAPADRQRDLLAGFLAGGTVAVYPDQPRVRVRPNWD